MECREPAKEKSQNYYLDRQARGRITSLHIVSCLLSAAEFGWCRYRSYLRGSERLSACGFGGGGLAGGLLTGRFQRGLDTLDGVLT